MTRDDWYLLKINFQSLQLYRKTTAVIFVDLAIFALSVKAGTSEKPFFTVIGTILLVGVLLHAYLLLHEATHSAVSLNRWLNDLTGHICGWLIAMPYLSRQRSHLLHHIWTGHPKGDPANRRLIQRFSVLTDDQARRLERIWRSWVPLLSINDRVGLWIDPFQKRRNGNISSRIDKEIYASYIYLFGYVFALLLLLGTGKFVLVLKWYLPALIFLFFLEELANLPHHAETPLLNEEDKALPYWEQHRVTHSCKSIPVWSRFFLLNFNLHTAHHLFPWIPWSGLPQVHCEISQKLPDLEALQQTINELDWSMKNRKKSLLKIMGHYFDKVPKTEPLTSQHERDLALQRWEAETEIESDLLQ